MDREPLVPRKIIIRRSSQPNDPNTRLDDIAPQAPVIRVSRYGAPVVRRISPSQDIQPSIEPATNISQNTDIPEVREEPASAAPNEIAETERSSVPHVPDVAPRAKRDLMTERERHTFSEPPREEVVMSPQIMAAAVIIRKLGFVPENIEAIVPKFVRAQNALKAQVMEEGSEEQAIRLEDEFLEAMRDAKGSEPNLKKRYELARGAAGIITLKNVKNGLTIQEEPPLIGVVVEKSPTDFLGSNLQIYNERGDIVNLRRTEASRQSRLQTDSYFPEVKFTESPNFKPAFEMPFFPPEMNVTVRAQQATLNRKQLREVIAKHAEVIDIVIGAGGWLEDKIESIYLLPNGRYVILDHDQTFQFRGQRSGTASFIGKGLHEVYTPAERTKSSVAEALKRFTEVAGIIRDQSLKDKLTLMYHRVKDDSEPPMTPAVFSRVVRNIDDIGIDDLKEKTLSALASEFS